MLTRSQKKYLFAIYSLGQSEAEVRSAEVARLVGVTKPSTVKMMQRLIEDKYITKEAYGGITLTEKGIREANELYTPSVIIQHFLQSEVGVSEQLAKDDSVTIVSQLSDETLEKLVRYVLAKNDKRGLQNE